MHSNFTQADHICFFHMHGTRGLVISLFGLCFNTAFLWDSEYFYNVLPFKPNFTVTIWYSIWGKWVLNEHMKKITSYFGLESINQHENCCTKLIVDLHDVNQNVKKNRQPSVHIIIIVINILNVTNCFKIHK